MAYNYNYYPKELRALVRRKLGRCPKCMRWSARGTFISWAVTSCVYLVLPNPVLLGLTLLVATSFTLLWIAHMVTFTLRGVLAQKQTQMKQKDSAVGLSHLRLHSRREFVYGLGALSFLALFAKLSFAWGKTAQQKPCSSNTGFSYSNRVFVCATSAGKVQPILAEKLCNAISSENGGCKNGLCQDALFECFSQTTASLENFTCVKTKCTDCKNVESGCENCSDEDEDEDKVKCFLCRPSNKNSRVKCECACS